MRINAKNQVKILLTYEGVLQKDLAMMLSKKTGKKYSAGGLSHKLNRGHLTYDEMVLITEILGYDITFTKRETEA